MSVTEAVILYWWQRGIRAACAMLSFLSNRMRGTDNAADNGVDRDMEKSNWLSFNLERSWDSLQYWEILYFI